jgi:hypothetical protein
MPNAKCPVLNDKEQSARFRLTRALRPQMSRDARRIGH